MLRNRILFQFIIVFQVLNLNAQTDLQRLSIEIEPNFSEQSLLVSTSQHWTIDNSVDTLSLRLYPDFEIISLKTNDNYSEYRFAKKDSLLLIPTNRLNEFTLNIEYSGKPKRTDKAPWESGFIWTKSSEGNDWLTLACQNEGSAIWWPSPTRYSDKPDTCLISCIYDKHLFFKSNGRMVLDSIYGNKRKTTWKTTYPINTYNIAVNLGDYSHWSDTIKSTTGQLISLDFYPLSDNFEASKKQFKQVKPMISCFENAFGHYPFINDGYSVVETPYAGMEHQSCIAYGNGYTNGYNGKDYSGLNLDFDFILIHESGHEWWGNSISAKNKIDFWLQEAFCTYAELVYVDCRYGYDTAVKYINLKKKLIENKGAILSSEDSGSDMYMKGALMLNTLSNFLDSKEEWRSILKEFYTEFANSSIESETIFSWFSDRIEECTPDFFRQYLEIASPPIVEFNSVNKGDSSLITLRVVNGSSNFKMPIFLVNDELTVKKMWIGKDSKTIELMGKGYAIDESKSYFLFK